jgi:phage-related baseplate assembly protein
VLGQAISGVDTVSNASPFINGADAETDAALRVRFVAFIASLARATKTAIGYAISGIATNLTYTLVENQSYAGASQPGYFYVVVNDGTGSPPSTVLTAVAAAIDAVRPVTSTFGVFPPTVVTATIAMTITTAAGYSHSALVTQVQTALIAYVKGLPMGTSLPFSRLAQIAYDVSPGITNVTAVTLNGVTTDLTATAQQVINTSSGSVTVS